MKDTYKKGVMNKHQNHELKFNEHLTICLSIKIDHDENKLNKMNCELMLTYDTPTLRQTESRNVTGPKTLPTIWGTYMKLLTKYQISAINSCREKCDKKYLGMDGRTELKQYIPPPPVEPGYNNSNISHSL